LEDFYWCVDHLVLDHILSADFALPGITGHNIQRFFQVTLFRVLSIMNFWECCLTVVWVGLFLFLALARFDISAADVLTSRTSTLPYNSDKMLKMMQLVKNARGMPARCSENDC
jgi:hypothetical protein